MRETSRQALLLGGQPLEGIAALSMPQYAWQFRRTSCLIEAEALLTSSPPPVGVIVLEGLQASAPRHLERVLNLVPDLLWVALFPPPRVSRTNGR